MPIPYIQKSGKLIPRCGHSADKPSVPGSISEYWVDTDTDSIWKAKLVAGSGLVWVDIASGGGGAVDSVFSRTGVVTAVASDYDASQVDNDSLVSGLFVSDGLNTLKTAMDLNTTHRGVVTGNPHVVTASDLGLVIGTNVQAWDSDLDTYAGKTPPTGDVVGTTDTQPLTNKTITALPKLTISDSASLAPLNVTERATAPSSPSANDIYLDSTTTPPSWKRYTGSAWEIIGDGGGTKDYSFFTAASTYTTTSSTFVDVDATDFSLTIDVGSSGAVMIGLSGYEKHTDSGKVLAYNVSVDGTDEYTNAIILRDNAGNSRRYVSWSTIIDGLSVGSHTFKLRWYGAGTTFSLYADSTFWVKEI